MKYNNCIWTIPLSSIAKKCYDHPLMKASYLGIWDSKLHEILSKGVKLNFVQ